MRFFTFFIRSFFIKDFVQSIIKSELISVRSKWNWQKNYTDIAYKIYFKFFKAEQSS
jgi:hypothetical protein